VSPEGAQGFNVGWQTSGFRRLSLDLDGAAVGDLVQVYTTDVGGGCQTAPYMVQIDYSDGSSRSFQAGSLRSITAPAWPSGTLSLVPGELDKAAADRPYAAPGSPAVWVPNGEFFL
jgi:hypothetical protein